ncbi:CDP-diacylglycerol--glycerol-3-phosphate 3-phosphatidyltransferase [Mycoplasmopsis gallinacea]|uniref:CDP-diacylglycerol--glycerol-3-phosphate 3-phosphatidyltransferase n=1 Tax=Mycoplasmopsis gallinacea TaxID=29556 RepID=UPI001E553793|nr:CDP-diacylglycerol--glycerol-3-phosphate 3-phosphatidyltransferase [Mycoplasmopsis gallinacea]
MKFLKELNLPNKLTLLRIALFIPMIFLMIANIYILRTSDGFWWSYMKYVENHNLPTTYSLNGLYTKIGAIDIVILLFFIGAMVTDFLDGYFARKNNQVTEFGKLWDPLADKIITTLTLIYFAVMNYVPFWIVLIFVIRDLIVDGSRVTMAKNNIGVEASIWGKLKTLIMTAGIIIVFIYQLVFSFNIEKITYFDKSAQSWAPFVVSIPLLVAAGFSVFSGFLYVRKIWPIIRESK